MLCSAAAERGVAAGARRASPSGRWSRVQRAATRRVIGSGALTNSTPTTPTTLLLRVRSGTPHHQSKPLSVVCRAAALDAEDVLQEEDGSVTVRDDLEPLLLALPEDIRATVANHPRRASLLEVVLDLGRRPEARFLGSGADEDEDGAGASSSSASASSSSASSSPSPAAASAGREFLREAEVTAEDLAAAERAVGEFGGDNRAGVQGTLHRISAIRNRRGTVIGLTCRVGRAVTGHISLIRDILDVPNSILFLGRPGVGKTTVIREMARVLADELHKRVVIVDTSNEIGGDGDVPHPAIGGARRMQVPDPGMQHRVMVEAVENHMPEIVIVDEIGTEAEALACRTIAERGVQLVGTAHGQLLENLMKNPTLSDLVGGIQSVTLGDDEARARGTQKSVLERKAPPTFPLVIEMRERAFWVTHWVEDSVDCLLHSKTPIVQVRRREPGSKEVAIEETRYDAVDGMAAAAAAAHAAAAAAAKRAKAAEAAASAAAAAAASSSSAAAFLAKSEDRSAAEAYAAAAAAGQDPFAATGSGAAAAAAAAAATAAPPPPLSASASVDDWASRLREVSDADALAGLSSVAAAPAAPAAATAAAPTPAASYSSSDFITGGASAASGGRGGRGNGAGSSNGQLANGAAAGRRASKRRGSGK